MKKQTKYLRVFFAIVACYVAGYSYLRLAGDIIRIQNKTHNPKNQIKARANSWDNLDAEMKNHSNSIIIKTVAKLQKIEEPTLNTAFWPLRKLETAFRNCQEL